MIIVIACTRVIATYHVFSETFDESLHIATGLEWLGGEKYSYEFKQPPLAQAASAVGPFLDGRRSHPELGYARDVHAIMYDGPGGVLRTLTLARYGLLPFLLLGILVVAAWGRRIAGDSGGLIAALLFSTTPTVLGHAGLANTDVAHASTLAAALLAGVIWLSQPSTRQSVWLGLAMAAAILCKLSAIPFLVLAGGAIVLARWMLERNTDRARPLVTKRDLSLLLLAAAVSIVGIIVCYRFSVGNVEIPRIGRHVTVLAPEFFDGLRSVYQHNHTGNQTFFLGEVSSGGWWYYFPVMLAVKTPLPLLVLAAFGAIVAFRHRASIEPMAPVLCAIAVLAFSMTAKINIGVRHVLGVIPLFAVVAGYAAVYLWTNRSGTARTISRAVVVVLLVFQFGESVAVHPDYLAYFNALAGSHPERISVGSDLDWGQDLFRLRDELRRRKIDTLSIAYFGSADVTRYGMPNARPLKPYVPVSGWVALSEGRRVGGAFDWLPSRFTPTTRIGKSIFLYYVPTDSVKPAR